MSLVTDAYYKYYLGISQSDSITTTIAPLINAAEKRIKEFLNRDIEITSYTDELYDGNGKSILVVRQFPLVSVSAIKRYDGLSSGSQVWTTLVQGTDYDRLVISKEAFSIYLDNGTFEEGIQNYKISYIAGYGTVATGSVLTNLIPDDIQMACKELVALYWKANPANQSFVGVQNLSDAGGGASSAVNIDLDAEWRILKKIAYHKAINV